MQADIVAIAVAFILGFGARLVGLPPLVGYLVAGFLLFGLGMEASPILQEFSEIGVTLLLFSIGLKLRLASLLMPQIWAVASLHMLVSVVLFSGLIYLLGILGLTFFSGLDFRTFGAAYYDADDLTNPREWLASLRATPGAQGIMYTTWQKKYELLGGFGDLVSEKPTRSFRRE